MALAAVAVAGCQRGASVTVDMTVPRPLVEPLDVEMGVYLDDALKNYVHEELVHTHGEYRIDVGASQGPVFAQVFDAMFDRVVAVEPTTSETAEAGGESDAGGESEASEAGEESDTSSKGTSTPSPTRYRPLDGPEAQVDGILVPSIDEVQFALPDQTGGEFYEVWIRYRMQLLQADGAVLGEWPVIGYGKANQRNYGTIDQEEIGLNHAAISAMRDAAAWLSFQFRDQAEVKTWLAGLEGQP